MEIFVTYLVIFVVFYCTPILSVQIIYTLCIHLSHKLKKAILSEVDKKTKVYDIIYEYFFKFIKSVLKKKVLICYADVGGGHKSVSNALKEYFEMNFNQEYSFELANIAKDYGDFLLKRVGQTYSLMIKRFPMVWEYAFVKFFTNYPTLGDMTLKVAWLKYGRTIAKFIEENPADLYISTLHFYGYFLSKYRRKYNKDFKIVTVVTDISYISFFWIEKNHDLIIMPTVDSEKHAHKLIEKAGVRNVIKTLGLPINTKYYESLDIVNAAKQNNTLNILLATGGEGANNVLSLCEYIDNLKIPNLSLSVSVGKNQKLADRINSGKWNSKVDAFTWIPSLIDKYKQSDLVITKAGPTTIWECMVLDLPMIIFDYIKGQEEGNTEFALSHCRAIYEKDFKKISEIISEIQGKGMEAVFPYPKSYSKEFATTNWTQKVCDEIMRFMTF